jgi:RimJ/RimL family protein N-acetyltransferase
MQRNLACAPILRTARLDLIAATPEHLRVELENPASLGEALGAVVPTDWPPGVYDRDAMEFFRKRMIELGERSHGWFSWYAIRREEGPAPRTLVGAVGYLGPPGEDGSVEIGYSIASEAQGKGYATEVIGALVGRAFLDRAVRRVLAEAHESNAPSVRALERHGFVRVGAGRDPGCFRFERRPDAPDADPHWETWKGAVWDQYGAAIDAMANAIHACPDSLWGDRSRHPEYWYVAYHTIFLLDYYLSDSLEGFTPPPGYTLSELDPSGVLPDRVYSKEELLDYLEHGRRKLRGVIEPMDSERAREVRRFGPNEGTLFESLLYTMRHMQHHAAQLNLILRQVIDSAPNWVSRSKVPLREEPSA